MQISSIACRLELNLCHLLEEDCLFLTLMGKYMWAPAVTNKNPTNNYQANEMGWTNWWAINLWLSSWHKSHTVAKKTPRVWPKCCKRHLANYGDSHHWICSRRRQSGQNIVTHSNMTLKETERTVVVSPVVDSSVAGRHMQHSVSSRQNSHTVRGAWEETIPAWGTWAARGHGTLLSISSTSTPANKDSGTMQPMHACMRVQWSTYFPFMHRCLYNYVHVYSNVDIQLILRIERLSTLHGWMPGHILLWH